MLSLQGLTKRYATGDLALNDVTLEVPRGQVMALIGPSGAGKSTLIRCINRLVEPTSGQVMLDGRNLAALSKAELRLARRSLGMIFQEYALIERLTVMENVLSGRLGYVGFWRSWTRRFPKDDIRQAYAFLDRVGLAGFENKRADALSGGQRQRVGIARALMQSPQLLLVDEPTASLDPKTSRQIMRLLCELCRERGLSAIVNIHDVALATQFSDRIVGLRKGTVVFDGLPSQLDTSMLTEIYGAEDWDVSAPSTADEENGGGGDGSRDAQGMPASANPAAPAVASVVALTGEVTAARDTVTAAAPSLYRLAELTRQAGAGSAL